MRPHYTELAEQAAAGMHGADERAWVLRMLPDYDNLRAAFEHTMADGDVDLAMRLVVSLPEFVHLRIGYESSGWAERALDAAGPDHALFAAAVGFAARGAWNRGDFERARAIALLAQGRTPGRGNGRVAYPGDVLADLALYEGRCGSRAGDITTLRWRAPATMDDPIRLVWTLVLRGNLSCGAAHRRRRCQPRRGGGADRRRDCATRRHGRWRAMRWVWC